MEIFDNLPETYPDKELKMRLIHFYLDWVHRMDFKYKEFSQDQIAPITNKNNKTLVNIGIAELVVYSMKCEYNTTLFYLLIDKTGKLWLYLAINQRILVSSLKDIDHLISLITDPILMED